MNEEVPERSAERPFECSECKKAIKTLYTVVEQGSVSHTVMCGQCPQLELRLHGTASHELAYGDTGPGAQALVCKSCGTSLANVRSGMPLGCIECYETFSEQLVHELVGSSQVPQSFADLKRGTPLHVGRGPGEEAVISPALRLHALNQALVETLNREDYEQAAWLRDQIKQLTEQSPDGQ